MSRAMSPRLLIDSINELDRSNKGFWLAGLAKEAWPVLIQHLDKLEPLAKQAVIHYSEVKRIT